MAKKQMRTEYEDGKESFVVGKKESAYTLETDKKGTFKLVEEEILEAHPVLSASMIDDEKLIYFKAKVIVSGKIEALRNRNIEQMDVKIVYTKEYPTLIAAKKANYTGIRAAGLADRHTLLS